MDYDILDMLSTVLQPVCALQTDALQRIIQFERYCYVILYFYCSIFVLPIITRYRTFYGLLFPLHVSSKMAHHIIV